MSGIQTLSSQLQQRFGDRITELHLAFDEITMELPAKNLREVCIALRDEAPFEFSMLLDVCGVDYLQYGVSEWQTESTTFTGFSRAVETLDIAETVSAHDVQGAHGAERAISWNKPRFAVVYHLLSLSKNHRVRLRVFLKTETPYVESVVDIWPSANWFEREAFDLFGIVFRGHPDLRRILTDYGFIGHPFRKDFPLIGQVEMRYDAALQRCIYEPVSIQPRTLVPKVIRDDNRYKKGVVE